MNEPTESAALIRATSIEAALVRRDRLIAAARHLSDLIGDGSYQDDWFPGVAIRAGSRFDNDPWTLEKACKLIDRNAWNEVVASGPVWTVLDARARADWRKAYDEFEFPPFTPENVEAELRRLIDARGDMMKRGVADIFGRLSPRHVTNHAGRFTRRMVVTYMCHTFKGCTPSLNCHSGDALDDLDRVLHVLRGLPEPDRTTGAHARFRNWTGSGPWVVEFPFFQVRCYRNGNGHLFLNHAADLLRLNKVLAMGAPNAIPSQTGIRKPRDRVGLGSATTGP